MAPHSGPSSHRLPLARLAAILFWSAMALVVWGELSPDTPGLEIWDKLQHFGAYAVLAGLVTVALRASGPRWLAALTGLVALGAGLELLQGLTGRDMSAMDEVANTLGVLAGAVAGWLVWRVLRVVGLSDGD